MCMYIYIYIYIYIYTHILYVPCASEAKHIVDECASLQDKAENIR